MTLAISEVDRKNVAFWNELCGSHLASVIGVTDDSPKSLKRFDDWFFAYYPYLFLHIPFDEMKDKDVLEVGLGYGTVAQRIAESGANYVGLDLADGPVAMAEHRLRQADLPGRSVQGSVLNAPFEDESFDMVVTIGCLHHTGDLQRAIDECYRVLRPGGKLVVMLYYAYSFRRWVQARNETARYLLRETFGHRGVVQPLSESEKWNYDHNADGQSAPHTDFVSARSLRSMCSRFSTFEHSIQNMNNERPFEKWRHRRDLLKTLRARYIGLEIWATATK